MVASVLYLVFAISQALSAGAAVERPDTGPNRASQNDLGQPPQTGDALALGLPARPARVHGNGRERTGSVVTAYPRASRALSPLHH